MLLKRRTRNRKGAAAVEMAVVAPVLVLLTFSMIEGSRFLMVSNAVQGAAREATRSASIFGKTNAVNKETAVSFLKHSGVDTSTIQVDINSAPSSVPGYEVIQATIAIDYSKVSWLGDPFSLVSEVKGYSATLVEVASP